jgi:hypothetical protein
MEMSSVGRVVRQDDDLFDLPQRVESTRGAARFNEEKAPADQRFHVRCRCAQARCLLASVGLAPNIVVTCCQQGQQRSEVDHSGTAHPIARRGLGMNCAHSSR